MPTGFELLNVIRIQRAMDALQDVRNRTQNLLFLGRTPMVDAIDGEIMARFIGRVQIADMFADDGVAGVYSLGKFSTYTSEPANLKVGTKLTQAEINEIFALTGDDSGLANQLLVQRIEALRIGVMQRIETILVGMHLDSFSYNRLGFQVSGATWGMPTSLKANASAAWAANPSTAKPIEELLTLKLNARTMFGADYDRITMSTAAFRAMIATAEFQAKAKLLIPTGIDYTNFSLTNLPQQQSLAETLLQATIEFYDARYFSQATTGAPPTSAPYLPLTKVILSSKSNDNNPAVQDWANGITTESRVSAAFGNGVNSPGVPGLIGSFARGVRGPIGYATLEGMNPPNVSMWAVARGWARKHVLFANAVYDTGAITDPVAVYEPY